MDTSPYYLVWKVLVLLRVFWTLLPQTGYIHPDEFFQTTEVLAGDVLNLEVNRPWEFNPEFPLRSIILPYVVLGPAFYYLRRLSDAGFFPEILAPPTYWMLVAPRLIITIISVAMDVIVVKIARNLRIHPGNCVLSFATSYVTFVHLTRTFNNTLEAFLFTLLLYYCTKKYSRQHSNRTEESWDNFMIALILSIGVFNRPTFAAFALIPVLNWLLEQDPNQILKKMYECSTYGLFFVICFMLADTMYFRGIPLLDIYNDIMRSDDFWGDFHKIIKFTPYLWLSYNLSPTNVAEHGLHSRFNHLLVNMPMLFGPCLVVLYSLSLLSLKKYNNGQNQQGFLSLTILIPAVILSIQPHQEARFLVPLITPVSILCGSTIFAKKFPWKVLQITWIFFNIFGAVVFGVLHQGGVTRSISYLQNHINEISSKHSLMNTPHQVIFHHTYMPPLHLFGKPSNGTIADLIHIHDLKGSSYEILTKKITALKQENEQCEIILVTPATVTETFCEKKNLKFTLMASIWPHISFEDPPDLSRLWSKNKEVTTSCVPNSNTLYDNVLDQASLHILHVNIS